MFPVRESSLSFNEIADYWSREICPPASSNELFKFLVSAWWLGELRGDSRHSRLQLLKIMFTSKYRDDLGIIFVAGDERGPPGVELPDGSFEPDMRREIRVPSGKIESWDEAACTDAFHALAKVTKEKSTDTYREFAVFLPFIKLTYEEFNAWLRTRGYSVPTFWQPRDQDHHHGDAASATGSDDEAPPHLGRVAQNESKTWHAKRGKHLTPSETAVFEALIVVSPDGILDHKAQARDKRILKQLEIAKQAPISPRTIQRTLKKIHFT
jgi:hypothetical protein